jgi:hypothetical protein
MTCAHSRLGPTLCTLGALLLCACESGEGFASADNPGFEPSCDTGTLCDWTVIGQTHPVPTWHDQDHGTELLGAPVSLSQLLDPLAGGACVRFELIANVAAAANVSVSLDFDDDGTVEYSDSLPAAEWTLLTYQHRVPPAASRLRIRIDKQAPGRAALARLDLTEGECDNQ